MKSAQVGIIGGGLSGLYAAYLLEQIGITDYVLLEAKSHLGGRLISPVSLASENGLLEAFSHFDLGGTWYWPDIQPHLDRVVRHFGLKAYPQSEDGDMMIDRANFATPVRVGGYVSAPPMMRLAGGMRSFITSIADKLSAQRVFTSHVVQQVVLNDAQIELQIEAFEGQKTSIAVKHVLIAIPPRMATSSIKFTPELPGRVFQNWLDVNTWMAPHAKYLAVYETPFWRSKGLSGEARSDYGPLGEIHDASTPEAAALFGFIQLPLSIRKNMGEHELKAHCRAQLVRLFGQEAANVKHDFIKDWAQDAFTAVSADLTGDHHHSIPPTATIAEGDWRNKLIGVASEWSASFPGYIAGAIDAATNGVQMLQKELLYQQANVTKAEEQA